MAIYIHLFRGRTTRETITVKDAAGAAVAFEVGDVFRVAIGRDGEAPLLDLSSASPAAGGTTVQAANPSQVVFDEDDTAGLDPGVYNCEAFIIDASDGERIKFADKGIAVVHQTQTVS